MSTYAFFLNSFNDIDNMTPVIWKFLEKGESTIVIFGTDFDYKNDYRINFLQEKYDLEIFDFPSDYKSSIRRKMKYILGLYKPYEVFLKERDVSVCVDVEFVERVTKTRTGKIDAVGEDRAHVHYVHGPVVQIVSETACHDQITGNVGTVTTCGAVQQRGLSLGRYRRKDQR